jgi:biopolymer transport protein TolR
MAIGGGGGGGPLSEINVTPLVDVMLVLLVMFMVTAPLINTGVDLELPQGPKQQLSNDEGKIVLVMDAKGVIKLGDKEMKTDTELSEAIKANPKIQAESELFLQAHKDLSYGSVVRIMGIVKDAGVKKLNLVTNPNDEGPSKGK